MDVKSIHSFPRETVERWLLTIPFYKTVKQQSDEQFEQLLRHAHIGEFEPGEWVLRRGEKDQWLYFLLRGGLEVYPDEEACGPVINRITPGEVFGDLAMLVGRERTASLRASPEFRQCMVFCADFSVFSELDARSSIALATQLAFYRNSVHNLRWKLEVYRNEHPEHRFANRHRVVKLYTGVRDTREELEALHAQAQALARLLMEWNGEFGGSPPVHEHNPLARGNFQ